MSAGAVIDDYLSELMQAPPALTDAPAVFLATAVVAVPLPVPVPVHESGSAIHAAAVASVPPPLPAAGAPDTHGPVQAGTPVAAEAPLPLAYTPQAGETGAVEPQSAAVALLHSIARRQDGGGQNRRAGERSSRWLRLRCDEQSYALELMKVQEVILPGLLVPLRGAAPHMLGVMNLRGQIVPVLDLGVYLQREEIVAGPAARIVVIEEKGETLGLSVSSVEDVVSVTDSQIEAASSNHACCLSSNLFRGVARVGGRTLILLDASRLLQ